VRIRALCPCSLQPEFIKEAYGDAVLDAIVETGLDASTFPAQCPYDAAEMIRER